jgi:hypothetical protein
MSNNNETPEYTISRHNFDSGKPPSQTRKDLYTQWLWETAKPPSPEKMN